MKGFVFGKYKFTAILLLLLAAVCFIGGCGKKEEEGTKIRLSFISFEGTKIIEQDYYLMAEDRKGQLEEVMQQLSVSPAKLEYQVPLAQGFTVLSYYTRDNNLNLNLSAEYKKLDSVTEILTRASLVKSLTQIEGIDSVTIRIAGEALKNSSGKEMGKLTADMFIDNAGEEISTYDKVTIRLYFANEAGDALIAVDRSKAYNTNISLDKLVVEELIKGPEASTAGVYPTINPNTKLVSTIVKDKVCYVNFDSTFLTQVYNVDTEVVIYSIVNSLCGLSGIDRVKIYVDGNENVLFREVLPLTTVFSKDTSYIQTNS